MVRGLWGMRGFHLAVFGVALILSLAACNKASKNQGAPGAQQTANNPAAGAPPTSTAPAANSTQPSGQGSYPPLTGTGSASSSAQSGPQAPPANAPQPSGQGAYPSIPGSSGSSAQSAPQNAAAQPTTPAPAEGAEPGGPAEPVTITIPAGARVSVRTTDSINSGQNTAGQEFRATLAAPLRSHGRVVMPAGTAATLLLADVRSAGRIKGRAELEVRLSSIEYRGRTYAVHSSIYEEQGKGRGRQTAERTGIGAAAGAIIGAIAGGGKGAAIGSAAGGGAGLGVN
ncbi:MAG: hypothetical protein JOZ22_27025, partial [Acidobacteriia bacterium]|nr:hypothetical protein [Terriglobia bacterium]